MKRYSITVHAEGNPPACTLFETDNGELAHTQFRLQVAVIGDFATITLNDWEEGITLFVPQGASFDDARRGTCHRASGQPETDKITLPNGYAVWQKPNQLWVYGTPNNAESCGFETQREAIEAAIRNFVNG